MTKEELGKSVRDCLDRANDPKPWSQESGTVLYSGISTIRKDKFYLMGMNPGGDGILRSQHESIINNLCAPDGTNSYTDQCWTCGSLISKNSYGGHLTNFQHRVSDLINMLGRRPDEIICTNLIFRRSQSFKQLVEPGEWAVRCWKVHEHILKIVQPEWIVMLGIDQGLEHLRALAERNGRYMCRKNKAETVPGNPNFGYQDMMIFRNVPNPIKILAVPHPSDLPFNRAGFGSRLTYPDEIKQFISANLH